jgi:DNA-binding CsgD family transcriptional regulator
VHAITPNPMAKPDAFEIDGADFAALIEAAYRPDGNDTDWLQRIVACAQPGLDRGRGLVGFLFAPGAGGDAAVTTAVGVGALPARPEALAHAFLPVLAQRADGAAAGTIRGNARAAVCDVGAQECSGIVATDGAERAGCALLAPLTRAARLSRAATAIWTRVAQHLGAALRMRREQPHEQTVWRGLLSGRWKLIDHFDAGGRRFVIARGKPPAAPDRRPAARLTERERDVCARAAAGFANKVIAADLGVAVSTVGSLLLRATRKLRCTSREELIRAFRFVEERWNENGSTAEHPKAAADAVAEAVEDGQPPPPRRSAAG